MTYDYREQIDSTNRIIEQLGELKQNQLLELNKEVDNITQVSRAERLEHAKKYFQMVMLPVLQDFAEMTSSLLVINEPSKNGLYIASIHNHEGFEITESCRMMRSLLVLADCIAVENEGDAVLTLVFDCFTLAQI